MTGVLSVFMIAAFPAAAIAEGTSGRCGYTTWTLWAGQTKNVGTVTVSNDSVNLYITYALSDEQVAAGTTFGELHAWAGSSLEGLPGGGTSRPSPGLMAQRPGGARFDATGKTSYTFIMPLVGKIVDQETCGATLFVVTHAEINYAGGGEKDGDTAYGGDKPGAGNAWWYYGEYTVCCDEEPPVKYSCDTMFGKGTHVFASRAPANPEGLPSLNLNPNRWGWAVHMVSPGTYVGELHAGAGRNRTNNRTNVGDFTIDWDGSVAKVTYDLKRNTFMTEVHIYAGTGAPTTIAPGRYGFGESFEVPPSTTTRTFTKTLSVEGDEAWFILHGVACRPAR